MSGAGVVAEAGSPAGAAIATGSRTNVLALVERCERAVNRKDLSDEELQELVAACDKISEQAESLLTTSRSD